MKLNGFSGRALVAALVSGMAGLSADLHADGRPPNVILIMADDLGAECLTSYGSTIYTSPNLDRMAKEGLRFENAYASPLCTPSRVMIMSGTYPNRNGFKALISRSPGSRMPADIKTFGHYFRDTGYKTAIAGKWQLGMFDYSPDQPVEHGFDNYCMWTWLYDGKKQSRYYSPGIYTDGKLFNGAEKDYGPDYYGKYVLDFIDKNKDQPFFIYFPMALVHYPFVSPPALRDLASTKFPGDLDKKTRAFGEMITYMDYYVGEIIARLKKYGLEKNTLVIFTGDNGTHASITSRLPGMELKGGKGSLTEAGSRVPFLAWWPGTIAPAVSDAFICHVDVLPTLASIAGFPLTAETDGMDLSHYFTGTEGVDRDHIFMYFKGAFVRDKRFRLNQDGKLYDIPVTSNRERYSEKVTNNPEYNAQRERLQKMLDQYLAMEPLYHGALTPNKEEHKKNKKDKKAEKKDR